jgi:peptidase C39-like protein
MSDGLIFSLEGFMSATHYSCIKQNRLGQSGAAAIATLASHYGLPLSFPDMRSFIGLPHLNLDLLYLLFASRKLGFEAVPLEGEYEDLPDVPSPSIVLFKGDGHNEDVVFNVLYEVDAESALIGDVTGGEVKRISKERFSNSWTGDVIQILPNDQEFSEVRELLGKLHNPWTRLRSALGWSPLSFSRLLFVPATVAVIVLAIAGWSPLQAWSGRVSLLLVALCSVLSLWSYAFSESCASCSRTGALVGSLPLAPVGAAFYAALLAVGVARSDFALFGAGIFFAAGVHLSLVALLLRSRLLCRPCIGTALFAIAAAALLATYAAPPPTWAAVALFAGASSTLVITAHARKLYRLESHYEASKLARRVVAEGGSIPPGTARAVVYKRKNCPLCSFYEVAIGPAIKEDFGDRVIIEEREAVREKIPTPFVVITGTINLSLTGLTTEDGYNRMKSAIEAALSPIPETFEQMNGIYFMESL